MVYHPFNPWRIVIGTPYASPADPPRTFDCYSLVAWVREHCYLIKTPLLVDPTLISPESVAQLIELHRDREIYVKVDNAEPSDIMIFSPNHVGVVVEGGVLSAVEQKARGGQVMFFDWRKIRHFFSDAYAVRLANVY